MPEPTDVYHYFREKLGRWPSDDTLKKLPRNSECGKACVAVIDAASTLIDHIRAAFGPFGIDNGPDKRHVLEVVEEVVAVYWRG